MQILNRWVRFSSLGWRVLLAFAVFLIPCAMLQAQQAWVVRPEWVRAHEDFLASDALAGRGSATRDEQIAAEYVASEFLAYGLKPAPGMSTMIQSAEVVSPELDGKSSLTVGAASLAEGSDYHIPDLLRCWCERAGGQGDCCGDEAGQGGARGCCSPDRYSE